MAFKVYITQDDLVDEVTSAELLAQSSNMEFTQDESLNVIIRHLKRENITFLPWIVLIDSPEAEREILNETSWRTKIDLSGHTKFRITLIVTIAGAAGADIHFEGSLNAVDWGHLDGDTGPEIAIDSTGLKDSGWVTLAEAYRVDDMYVRMMEKDGDGATDPVLRKVMLSFKA